MPPVVAGAAIAGGASLGAAYMQHRSANQATAAQQAAQEQAAQAEREREAEEKRRYRERWEDYQRRLADWEQRRREAQGTGPLWGRRSASRKPPTSSGVPPDSTSAPSMYGMNPATGLPRSLADIANWNDWSEYGLR